VTTCEPNSLSERIGPALARKRGKSEFTLRMEADQDAQPCLTGCLFCRWKYEGTVTEGRIASLAHRRSIHPGVPLRLRRRGTGFVAVRS
jgi:hypothetical protein